MPDCTGNNSDHCCYVNGVDCPNLIIDVVPGRKYACGLRHELGSWEAVYSDPRYTPIQAVWDTPGSNLAGYKCGEWPAPGFTCGTCGLIG